VDHIAVYSYMFRPLSAIVRLYYFLLYSKTIQYIYIYNYTINIYTQTIYIYKTIQYIYIKLYNIYMQTIYCIVLLYNRK